MAGPEMVRLSWPDFVGEQALGAHPPKGKGQS